MILNLHKENKIGYKQLTNADLGRQRTSHQTHIGLFGDVFTFLPNDIEIDDAIVIYEKNVEILSANINRIENPDNSHRSPKIRTGGRDTVSVVTFIRDKAKEESEDTLWYLFWFGLESEQPVFFLFNNKSETYIDMLSLGIDLKENVKKRLTPSDASFKALLQYLGDIVNYSDIKDGRTIPEELEVLAQTNEKLAINYRNYDLEKARERFRKIGKEGEKLVQEYFSRLKEKNQIINFNWQNEDEESNRPYDFSYETLEGTIIYLDVKTTDYDFEQEMIFSSQEINFGNNYSYHIYRVYTRDGKKYLRICKDAKNLFSKLITKTEEFKNNLNNLAKIESIKFAISPKQDSLIFGEEIALD